jgi:MFS family permease
VQSYSFPFVLGFGLVGLDRWIIAPLFPFMMKDLHLGYQDLGNIVGVMGITWGVFAAIMCGVSDQIGRRKILVPPIFIFSVLSGFSGIATGLMSLTDFPHIGRGISS